MPCLLFFLLPFFLVLQRGLCCYDDVGYALVAKNLVNGLGYATTINYIGSRYGLSLFDPALGQGPVGIFPVAVAFRLFGLNPLLPGIMQIVCEGFLLLLAVFWLAKRYPLGRLCAAFSVSLVLITLVSDAHYEHWYAMLGESVAALLLLAGFVAWDKAGPSVRGGLLTGFLLGLAVLTKEIAALFVVAFVGVACWQLAIRPGESRLPLTKRVHILGALILAGLLPFFLFEGWKLWVLGGAGYLQNWHRHLAFIASYAPVQGSFWQHVIARAHLFAGHYFFPALFVGLVIAYGLTLQMLSPKKASLPWSLGCGCLVFFGYWLFFSTGPARHLYIGIILFCFFVPVSVLQARRLLLAWLPTLCCLFFLLPQAATGYAGKAAAAWYALETGKSAVAYKAEHAVLQALSAPGAARPIYTPAWAHIVMLEYLASGWGLFSGWDRMPQSGGWVVLNDRITVPFGKEREYADFLRRAACHRIYRAAPYTVYACAPAKP